LNLDAELELVREGYVPRLKLLAQLAEHGAGSRALLGPEDVLLEPGVRAPSGLVGRAWCPTPRALAVMREAGVDPEPHPDVSVLRRVNHRLFAHEVGGGLAHQKYFTDQAELEARLLHEPGPWLVKRPLAFAGRGQRRFYGTIDDKQRSWLDVSLARDGLIAEPLVQPLLEFSLHGFVWQNGDFQLGEACTQAVTDRGVFRGVRATDPAELSTNELAALHERGNAVAAALHAAAYFGPFGIDAYRYRHHDTIAFCPLSEINARYTMSFVTGFRGRPLRELVL